MLPQSVIDRAIALRKEKPLRTVEHLITMIETEGLVPERFVRRSTLSAHLKKARVERAKVLRKQRTWQRYTANEVHEIWQCDVCDSLRIPDPQSSGQMRVARLVAVLDDKSRYICCAFFSFRENLPILENALKKAIISHGTPRVFYCDNAKIFQSAQLTEVAARLGFDISALSPIPPPGSGKLEKFFGYIEGSFRPEAGLCVQRGTIENLDDLNRYFAAWLEKMYHERVHRLKKRPSYNYVTVVADSEHKRVLFATPGKGAETLSAFCEDFCAHHGNPEQIKVVSCDMSPAFIAGIQSSFPNAKLTFDIFHVTKLLGDTVDEVRRNEKKRHPELKRTRYLWLMNPRRLKEEQQAWLSTLSQQNLKTAKAYQIRMNFSQLWEQPKALAEMFLNKWYFWATHSVGTGNSGS